MPRGAPERRSGPVLDPWEFERRAYTSGARIVAGIDEAGRGPLAGPVVAAAVVLPPGFDLSGIDDSKKLAATVREQSYARLWDDESVLIGVGHAGPDEIDLLNILQATYLAMRRALACLDRVDAVLVDGLPVPGLHPNCHPLVGGDSRSASISAASIVAKVTRDRLMCGVHHLNYPEYGFARHKGYGTREHLEALRQHGPCPIHRRSFGPVGQCAFEFDGSKLPEE